MTLNSQLETALALQDAGKYKEALDAFKELRQWSLDGSQECIVLLNEAASLEALGRFKEAWQCLRRIRSLDTAGEFSFQVDIRELHLRFAEGKLYEAIKFADQFRTRHRRLLQLSDNKEIVYDVDREVAFGLVNTMRYKEGIEALLKLLPTARRKDHTGIHLYLGVAYEFSNQPERAIAEFDEALRANTEPTLIADAHYHLGAVYKTLEDYALAKEHFLAAESRKANSNIPARDLYLFLAQTSAKLGETEASERYLLLSRTV